MTSSSLLASVFGRLGAISRLQQVFLWRGGPPNTKKKKGGKEQGPPKKHKVNVRKQQTTENAADGDRGVVSRKGAGVVDNTDMLMEVLQPKHKRIVKISDEEFAQRKVIAKIWSMYCMRQHHARTGALAQFIECRESAMRVLEKIRPDLASKAKEIDNTPYPTWKGPPSITPPVQKPVVNEDGRAKV